MMEKIRLTIVLSELRKQPGGADLTGQLVRRMGMGAQGGRCDLKAAIAICGPSVILPAIPACGDDGLRVCRLVATDMAQAVIRSFEEDYPGDRDPRRALELTQAQARGETGVEALNEARKIALASAERYKDRRKDDDEAFQGYRASMIAAAAAEEDAVDAMYEAADWYLGLNDDDPYWIAMPGAMQGAMGAIRKFVRRYVDLD